MIDREKVIKGLEMHEKKRAGVGCLECPYAEAEGGTDDWCIRGLHRDILALLKEQEPITPTVNELGNAYCGNCGENVGIFGQTINVCVRMSYCPECGRKVKWDE